MKRDIFCIFLQVCTVFQGFKENAYHMQNYMNCCSFLFPILLFELIYVQPEGAVTRNLCLQGVSHSRSVFVRPYKCKFRHKLHLIIHEACSKHKAWPFNSKTLSFINEPLVVIHLLATYSLWTVCRTDPEWRNTQPGGLSQSLSCAAQVVMFPSHSQTPETSVLIRKKFMVIYSGKGKCTINRFFSLWVSYITMDHCKTKSNTRST